MPGVLIVFLLLVLVPVIIIIRYKAISSTPYDKIRAGANRSSPRSTAKEFDVFISYKSEDVTTARQIAEQLITNGINVWFAEYAIGLGQRVRFQEAVNNGIRASRYGVCFTNDKYIDSPYCRREIEQLLDPSNCGPRKIIEFRFPNEVRPHREYPQLATSYSVEFKGIDEALCHIASVTGVKINHMHESFKSETNRQVFHYHDREYSLDLGRWQLIANPGTTLNTGDVASPRFFTTCEHNPMWGHILVGPQDISRKAVGQGTLDDRAYYEEALKFADGFYKSIWHQKLVGVHLLFVLGFSHMALTTLFKPGIWARLYSVVLPFPGGTNDIEFTFFFFFKGTFKKFCRYAGYMDALVESITWG
jgi:hypothetical protein